MFRLASAMVIVAFTVAGCGSTTEERGISGAGIGAGAGALIGAVTGLSIVQGALIGAAAGGLTGVLTDESQVNLGDPVWKKKQQQKSTSMVRSIQTDLATLGYDPGPADGMTGQKTTDAIIRYQRDHQLLADGTPSPELARHIGLRVQQAGG
ncbi:MAG: peptidoglycan-binding protein [Alphaproteobacteria bacterium]|nr:MAG: peptidoglycan-binding protein [Alphaproteobacteria bacterium]